MPNDSLRKTFEEKFPTVSMRIKNSDGTTSEVYAGTAILSLLTEQIALARVEEREIIRKCMPRAIVHRPKKLDLPGSEVEKYNLYASGFNNCLLDLEEVLSPAPIIPEGEKLV